MKRFESLPQRRLYAGIGARSTPTEIKMIMSQAASALALDNYGLLSGAAVGADQAFEHGCDKENGRKLIFLPWSGFQDRRRGDRTVFPPTQQAMAISEEVWDDYAKRVDLPMWGRLKQPTRLLMARNAHQVFGPKLDYRASFVLCWTLDGATTAGATSKMTGGTGHAIRLADMAGIPVFNLALPDHRHRVMDMIVRSRESQAELSQLRQRLGEHNEQLKQADDERE